MRELVGDTGTVKASSGGIQITILDAVTFPWDAVMHALVDINQDVWVQRRRGELTVLSKPPSV